MPREAEVKSILRINDLIDEEPVWIIQTGSFLFHWTD
jgi:hypothetical protein